MRRASNSKYQAAPRPGLAYLARVGTGESSKRLGLRQLSLWPRPRASLYLVS